VEPCIDSINQCARFPPLVMQPNSLQNCIETAKNKLMTVLYSEYEGYGFAHHKQDDYIRSSSYSE
jgi:hypothetical protein